MLAGQYPSDEFAELRPRVIWDRAAGTVRSRGDARTVAVISGGTIPERGLFPVFLADDDDGRDRTPGPGTRARAARTGGRRVGELDEEMVYEAREGEVILLGASAWRIESIGHDRVLVSPGAGRAGQGARSGRATGSAVRSSWVGRWVPSRARWASWRRPATPRAGAGAGARSASATTSIALAAQQPAGLPRRGARASPAPCPPTGPSCCSASGTSWATGGSAC